MDGPTRPSVSFKQYCITHDTECHPTSLSHKFPILLANLIVTTAVLSSWIIYDVKVESLLNVELFVPITVPASSPYLHIYIHISSGSGIGHSLKVL